MKVYKLIALRFWVECGVNPLCVGWAHVSLVLYLPSDPLSKDPIVVSEPGSWVTGLDEILNRKSS